MKSTPATSSSVTASSVASTSNTPDKTANSNNEPPIILGNTIARLVPSDSPTAILVQWKNGSGQVQPATPARYLASIDIQELLGSEQQGREVLISFIDNDITQPVIIGVMASVVDDMLKMELPDAETSIAKNVRSDGDSVLINANKEIVLVCGKSSLTLRKDGKIIAKGTNILSRASGRNKIKGGSVEVN